MLRLLLKVVVGTCLFAGLSGCSKNDSASGSASPPSTPTSTKPPVIMKDPSPTTPALAGSPSPSIDIPPSKPPGLEPLKQPQITTEPTPKGNIRLTQEQSLYFQRSVVWNGEHGGQQNGDSAWVPMKIECHRWTLSDNFFCDGKSAGGRAVYIGSIPDSKLLTDEILGLYFGLHTADLDASRSIIVICPKETYRDCWILNPPYIVGKEIFPNPPSAPSADQKIAITGAVFTRDRSNPELGEAYQDPSGLVWGSILDKEGKVIGNCSARMARLPTLAEFKRLFAYLGWGTDKGYKPYLADGRAPFFRGMEDEFWTSTVGSWGCGSGFEGGTNCSRVTLSPLKPESTQQSYPYSYHRSWCVMETCAGKPQLTMAFETDKVSGDVVIRFMRDGKDFMQFLDKTGYISIHFAAVFLSEYKLTPAQNLAANTFLKKQLRRMDSLLAKEALRLTPEMNRVRQDLIRRKVDDSNCFYNDPCRQQAVIQSVRSHIAVLLRSPSYRPGTMGPDGDGQNMDQLLTRYLDDNITLGVQRVPVFSYFYWQPIDGKAAEWKEMAQENLASVWKGLPTIKNKAECETHVQRFSM